VAIDDLQWFDASSGAALAFALRRLDESSVKLLLARRVAGGGERPVSASSKASARRTCGGWRSGRSASAPSTGSRATGSEGRSRVRPCSACTSTRAETRSSRWSSPASWTPTWARSHRFRCARRPADHAARAHDVTSSTGSRSRRICCRSRGSPARHHGGDGERPERGLRPRSVRAALGGAAAAVLRERRQDPDDDDRPVGPLPPGPTWPTSSARGSPAGDSTSSRGTTAYAHVAAS